MHIAVAPPVASVHASAFHHWGHLAVALVLACAFTSGGGSMDRGLFDVATQLLALPLLAWAALALQGSPGSPLRRVAVAVAVAIAALPALQQLSPGQGGWAAIDARAALAADLAVAGVDDVRHAWALAPLAAERGGWSMLPALAVFLGVLALPPARHRPLLLMVITLVLASLLLGYLQLGAPQDSLLNPFPQWAPALNGVFANPNHQATALALSLAAIAALLLRPLPRDDRPAPVWHKATLVAVAALMLVSLPLTGSRGALLVAVLVLVGTVAAAWSRGGRGTASARGAGWRSRGGLAALAVVALGAVVAAVGWLRVDMDEEVRWTVAKATFAMGREHAPAGAGLGSFVPWFDQAATGPLVQWEYFNHAHNEYAQWWLESGVAGVALLLAVLALLAWCLPRRASARRMDDGTGRDAGMAAPASADRGAAIAAWAGCAVLLLHSIVDYPLRTPALMTVGALLAGVVVGQRLLSRARRTPDMNRDASHGQHQRA